MSVPLDRLYNFLHGVCNHDILIYRFTPHGSKKLDDLKPIDRVEDLPWLKKMTTPYVIFHDQEPLNFNLYQKEEIINYNTHLIQEIDPTSLLGIEIKNTMHLRCCIAAPFSGYDQVLIAHSEKNSLEVALYEQNNFIGVYYWSHAIIARDWYRFAELDFALPKTASAANLDFLIYNRAWSGTREYRLAFAELLADQNLISSCNVKFAELDGEEHYTSHVFNNPTLSIKRDDLHLIYEPNLMCATSSADYSNEDYQDTALDIVLETLFDDTRHHLTEKTLRPIACGRPFILAATPGSLAYLRSYGFETFNGLIDESYDSIKDPKLRLEAIASEMKRISQLAPDTKQALWDQLYAIAQRNKIRFFSLEFHDFVVQEFKNNFDMAVTQLTATGKYRQELENSIITSSKLNEFFETKQPHRSLDDAIKFKEWLTLQQDSVPVI